MKSITETIISLRPLHDTFVVQHGVGFNWFDYLGMGGSYAYAKNHYDLGDSTHPSLDEGGGIWSSSNWISCPRIYPVWYATGSSLPAGRDFSGGTPHLERLRRLDAWAQKSGCTIMLDTFLLPEAHVFPQRMMSCGENTPPDSSNMPRGTTMHSLASSLFRCSSM